MCQNTLISKIIFKNQCKCDIIRYIVDMKKYIQSDEDLDLSLMELRQQHSNIKLVSSGAQSGNFIMGDFQELDSGDLPIIGKKMENQYIKFGIGAFTNSAEKIFLE